MKEKTIEEKYKKLSQREHVLHRSGMYIGNTKKVLEEQWVWSCTLGKMEKKMVEFTPGFLKIFDEVLTNATDHASRDPTVTTIKVDFDKKMGEITVMNNGTGIPVVIHKEHNIYVPELIFGHLLSGSNYDDTQARTGAGTNGVGIKAVNIFSKTFRIETVDSENGLKFAQEYTENMSQKSKPKITKASGKSYTKITFLPDYTRFGMKGLDDDSISILSKRVYDCIACTDKHVGIYLNGEKLKGKGLADYARYFFEEVESCPKGYYDIHQENVRGVDYIWEWIVFPWAKFEHVSFVNGNSTYAGGKHVDHVMYQITSKIKGLLETKKKLRDVKPALIKERMFLFLRSTVVNPQFNSQTKEFLTTAPKDFGCRIEIGDKYIDKLWKSPIVEEIVEFCKMKESMDLAKSTNGRKTTKLFIPKLEDALWAGTAKSDMCTLILTEGDSAKTFALWGRSIVGPEKFGVFPLKGKLLNVRDASVHQLMNNEEINNLKQILGLKHGQVYNDTKDLRYGRVMALTDSDVDGSHIKALLINFVHANWPSLVKLDFIYTVRTPIIKAIKGTKVVEFFTEQDYDHWKEITPGVKGYQIRYFKGLGTSTKQDAQNTFKRIEELSMNFFYKDSKCDESILLAFGKDKGVKPSSDTASCDSSSGANPVVKCSDKRKAWLGNYDKDNYIDAKQNKVSYQDFINKELIHFSIYDNLRSIPSLCDGLKPSQRKILYYMLDKNITKSIKVAQLSGYVSAETSYHHGEASLQAAIVGMAQNFVGSNNINLLFPDGNHGTRNNSGKDAASPRYIFTRLSDITPHIFNQYDTPLLNKQDDDGQQIEPEWYIPVIPMILVNGCEGIGTGYSTYIPPHNPKDIIENILRVLDDKDPLPMTPYFRGFNGIVQNVGEGSYVTRGLWQRTGPSQVTVTELPVGAWVTPYKEFLESMIETRSTSSNINKDGKKSRASKVVLKDVKNKTMDENIGICFEVDFKSADDLDRLINTDTLEKELKLVKPFSTNNMYVFDNNSVPIKYKNSGDILLDFCDIRLELYHERKKYMLSQLEKELAVLQNKVRFINEYLDQKLEMNRKSKDFVVKLLQERKYTLSEDTGDFDYLVNMPLVSLTTERLEGLETSAEKKRQQRDTLKKKDAKTLWKEDLNSIMECLVKHV